MPFSKVWEIENNRFFLSHGGFVPGLTKYGDRFTRAESRQWPEIKLPDIKAAH
jgi:hypothetical protein